LEDDPYADVKQHRLTPELRRLIEQAGQAKAPRKPLTKSKKPYFIMVPSWWVDRLETPRNPATYPLVLQLLHLAWKRGSPSVDLSNERLAGSGVSRWAKWRVLADLEKLGLVTVERRRGKSPRVGVILREPSGGI
jgi:hypothetical protein